MPAMLSPPMAAATTEPTPTVVRIFAVTERSAQYDIGERVVVVGEATVMVVLQESACIAARVVPCRNEVEWPAVVR
jgi:hypothetical protein